MSAWFVGIGVLFAVAVAMGLAVYVGYTSGRIYDEPPQSYNKET